MLFRRASEVPKEVSDAKMTEWYHSLSEQDKNRTDRYLKDADTSSRCAFLSSLGDAALRDENWQFASFVHEECLRKELSAMQRFAVTESLIDSYIGTKRYDDAKRLCEDNLKLFASVRNEILKANGGSLPERLNCRNRYVDIVVGVESGYDEAFALLERFFDMGLISAEDLAYRKQSLKIHRLQRSFDGVFTYSYKN